MNFLFTALRIGIIYHSMDKSIQPLGYLILGALGFVALFVAFLPQIFRWRDRPKINLEHLNKEGYFKRFPDKYWLFLTIINNGRTTAKNVNVKIEKIIQDGTNQLAKNVHYSVSDTIEMLQYKDWKSIFFIEVKREGLIKTPTSIGESDFINIANINVPFWRKDTVIELLITGDNYKASTKSFKFVDNSEYDKVRLELAS